MYRTLTTSVALILVLRSPQTAWAVGGDEATCAGPDEHLCGVPKASDFDDADGAEAESMTVSLLQTQQRSETAKVADQAKAHGDLWQDQHAELLPPQCQDQANALCTQSCAPDLPCANSEQLIALKSKSDKPDGSKWRCYAPSTLNEDKTEYVSGSCYCTKHIEIRSVWMSCSPAPHEIPVFENGMKGAACYRIPVIVQTKSGALLAFAESRWGSCSDHAAHELAQRRSDDGGVTWGDIKWAVGSGKHWVGNPVVHATQSGRIVIMYCTKSHTCTGNCATGIGVVWSDNEGHTWTRHKSLNNQLGKASRSLPGPGNMAQTQDGRLVAAIHQGYYERVFIVYSDDDGEHWKVSEQTLPGMDESSVTTLPDGNLMMSMRHRAAKSKGRAFSVSKDRGLTWSPITYDPRILSPVCQGSVMSFDNVLYFSNPHSSTTRESIAVQCSLDQGKTWSNIKLVTSARTWGYSCLVNGKLMKGPGEGLGGIIFESSGGKISFADFGVDVGPTDRDVSGEDVCLLDSSVRQASADYEYD